MIKLLILLGKRHFKPTPFIDRYIQKLPRIYLIGCWARYGVRDYPLAFTVDNLPYVFNYDDHNGKYAEWQVIPILYTTTGDIKNWTMDKGAAELQVKELNDKWGSK